MANQLERRDWDAPVAREEHGHDARKIRCLSALVLIRGY